MVALPWMLMIARWVGAAVIAKTGTSHWPRSWIEGRAGRWGSLDGEGNWGHTHRMRPVHFPHHSAQDKIKHHEFLSSRLLAGKQVAI